MNSYDAIVVGLGAHGSSAARVLAQRGKNVIGFDRFKPPHDQGSSHGPSRTFREAYKEGSDYVPLVTRSRELFKHLEELTGESLFADTGGVFMGAANGRAITGMRRSAEDRGLSIQPLSPEDVRRQWPAFHIPGDWLAFFEERSGVIFPEKVVEANLKVALDAGADLRFNTPVTDWGEDGEGVFIETSSGRFMADSLILAAGAWMPGLLADLGLPLSVERVSLWMMEPKANREAFLPGNCPNASWEYDGLYPMYMSADFGTGVKIALDHHGTDADPETLSRVTTSDDEEKIREQIRRFVPDLDGRVLDSKVCMYTNTPDLDFVVDRHPEMPQVVIASACSGHGFKFAPVLGEVLADFATGEQPEFDLGMFSLGRFR